MAASYEDVERWKKDGREKGAIAIISMCDRFDYNDYPVFVMPGEDIEFVKAHSIGNMQTCNEVILLGAIFDEPEPELDVTLSDLDINMNPTSKFKKNKTRGSIIMNAQKARRLTEENILKDSNTIRKGIDDKILAAIAQKKFSIEIEVPPVSEKDMLRKFYTDLGFKWKQQSLSQRDAFKPLVEISW